MVAKKAPKLREPLSLYNFVHYNGVVICVELAESSTGEFHIYENSVNYETGQYHKHHLKKFREGEDDAALNEFHMQVAMHHHRGWEDVPEGTNLAGFTHLLEYTKTHMNKQNPASLVASPAEPAILEEGFRNLEL